MNLCIHPGVVVKLFFLQDKSMPDGSKSVDGDSITFTRVTRKHAGIYRCQLLLMIWLLFPTLHHTALVENISFALPVHSDALHTTVMVMVLARRWRWW